MAGNRAISAAAARAARRERDVRDRAEKRRSRRMGDHSIAEHSGASYAETELHRRQRASPGRVVRSTEQNIQLSDELMVGRTRPTANDYFAMVRRDELWVRGVLDESRANFGEAVERGRETVARNRIVDPSLYARLRDACDEEMERVRESIHAMPDARVRAVVTATTEDFESTIAITIDGVSVVGTRETAAGDYEQLKRLLPTPPRHPPTPNPP